MPKKILVIDDEELLIKTMNRLLEKKGYQVYSVKNGQDAKVMAEEEDFDLIISDVRMPGQNGIQIVKGIQKIRTIPVIFITGFADEKLEKEAKTIHPVAYLMKPFDLHEMLAAIEKAFKA